jgi:hypothetical protein
MKARWKKAAQLSGLKFKGTSGTALHHEQRTEITGKPFEAGATLI